MEIGAQFFTIRDFTKTLEDFEESLKKVADIGYKNVQISGTCEFEAEWLQEKLRENGLKCVLTHVPGDKLKLENIEKIAEDHKTFACENIGLGFFDFKEEEQDHCFAEFVKTYKPIAKKIKDCGGYFMYHHHAKEFQWVEGEAIIEKIAKEFAPDELGITLDTFWVQTGGGDPAAFIEKLLGRVPCIHLKDYKYDRKMAVIGEGNINFDRVFEKAEKAGTKYMLVEQDDCNGEDPFDCLRRSYNNLRALGFK